MFTKQEMNFKKIDYKLADMRGEVADNIERTEQEVKKLVEESHTYLQSLHGELDGFVKKRKNDKKQLKGELETIEKKVNGILDGEIVINQAIETIAVVVGLSFMDSARVYGGEYLSAASARNATRRRFKNRNVHSFYSEQCTTLDSFRITSTGFIGYEWVVVEWG